MKTPSSLFFGIVLSVVVSRSAIGAELPIVPVPRPVQFERPQLRIQLVEATNFVRAEEARRDFNVDGAGLSVAVLDTGLRLTHRDFTNRIVASKNFTTSGAPDDASDRQGHGTNVTGIVAAKAYGPFQGHTGMAPGAGIVALKVLADDGGGNFNDINRALQWVIDHRAEYKISVVNMSLGALTNDTDDAAYATDDIRLKIQQLRAMRVAVVVAAGNAYYQFNQLAQHAGLTEAAQGMGFPASVRETISVGSVYDSVLGQPMPYQSGAIATVTGPGLICPFSQRLHADRSFYCQTDLFAPGAPITSSGNPSDEGESIDSGTSQAAPIVSGIILLVQQFVLNATGNLPEIDDVERWLRDSAVKIRDGDDERDNVPHTNLEFRRIDAVGALSAARRDLTMQMLREGQPASRLETNRQKKDELRLRTIDSRAYDR
jgi:subtilisin family serine protease